MRVPGSGLALALGCAALQACLTPPVVLPGASVALTQVLEELPAPAEALELEAVDGARLQGVFVPAEEGAAVVLHLLGATDACGSPHFPQRAHVSQLRDLGLASLLVDYRGVGLSRGERSAAHLADDAWVMWQEAVRRAGGDPGRVGIRATSIGTIASALLLERGARPGALTWIAPVMPDTVTSSYARVEHGAFVSWLARALFAPVTELDPLAELRASPAPMLVCASEEDRFLPADQRVALKSVVAELPGGVWQRTHGGHYESAIAGRALFTRERTFWKEALPPARPAPSVQEFLQDEPELAAAIADVQGARERLEQLLVLKRRGDPRHFVAAAVVCRDLHFARELLWSLEQRPYLAALPFDELCETISLADPSGELPMDLLRAGNTLLDQVDRLGLPRFVFGPGQVARMVEIVDSGLTEIHMQYTFGAESAVLRIEPGDYFAELLARGLARADAERVLARILLRIEHTPERLRPESGGAFGLEVFADGAWKPLKASNERLYRLGPVRNTLPALGQASAAPADVGPE